MKNSNANNNWTDLNDITKHVISNKMVSSNKIKHLILSIVAVLLAVIIIGSVYFASIWMKTAFNMDDFHKRTLQDQQIIVDMNNVEIIDSPNSLRLSYFQSQIKNQMFEILKNNSWWKNILPTDINKYDFIYYDKDGLKILDKSFIQTDGFNKCQLKIKLKNSSLAVKIPVVVYIKNTTKFYQKFMMFNHFDSSFDMEQKPYYKGYLSSMYQYPLSMYSIIGNDTLYATITQQISAFMSDYSQEFATNSKIFPILSTIELNDIDIENEETIKPYLKLISNPNKYYLGNVPKDDKNQYLNFQKESFIYVNGKWLGYAPFFISYVSNPNVINDLLFIKPTTVTEIVSYFKSNPHDIPFSNTQQIKDKTNIVTKYSTRHFLRLNDQYYKSYSFFTMFFKLDNWITNRIINIEQTTTIDIDQLTKKLITDIWTQMLNSLKGKEEYFNLWDDDPTRKDWEDATANISTLQQYVSKEEMKVDLASLTTIQYLDANYNILDPVTITNLQQITKIKFNVGPEQLNNSFKVFYKVNWK